MSQISMQSNESMRRQNSVRLELVAAILVRAEKASHPKEVELSDILQILVGTAFLRCAGYSQLRN